jgi:hypothetical protein
VRRRILDHAGGAPSDDAGGAPNQRDAEDAEPRLATRPRRARYNRTIRCATPDFEPADASLMRGNAHGTPLSMKAVPLNIETSGRMGANARRSSGCAACRSRVARRQAWTITRSAPGRADVNAIVSVPNATFAVIFTITRDASFGEPDASFALLGEDPLRPDHRLEDDGIERPGRNRDALAADDAHDDGVPTALLEPLREPLRQSLHGARIGISEGPKAPHRWEGERE